MGARMITSAIRHWRRSTADNVRSLTPVALVQTGMTASFETTPIVVNGVMYLTTPVVDHKMKVLAVNAVTGERLWEVTYNLGSFQICCGPVNRGVAVGYGKVYVVTLDDHLLALDAADGHTVWDTTIVDSQNGYSETLAPQIFDGMVIVGSAGGEWASAVSSRLTTLSMDSSAGAGCRRIRKPMRAAPGRAEAAWCGQRPRSTPRSDSSFSAPATPTPTSTARSGRGTTCYTDSIVALDVHTGELKWYYQEVKHDVWDYDAVSNVVLFDVHRNGDDSGRRRGGEGRLGIHPRSAHRQADPQVRSLRHDVEEHVLDAHAEGVDMLPGANGGAEWSPPAYSPQTHYLYIMAMDQLMRFTTKPAESAPGLIRLGSAFTNVAPGGDSGWSLRRARCRDGQDRVAVQDAAALDRRGSGHGREPRVHGRRRWLVRCIQCHVRRARLAL